MADTAGSVAINGNSVFGLKDFGNKIISTLLYSCVVLAALAIRDSNKDNMFWNPGSPNSGMLLSGADVPGSMKKEIMECESYSPLLEAVWQADVVSVAYRPNSPTLAVGSGATFSVTVTNGAITAVAVTNGGTGYAGAPPTLVAVDSVNLGQGAILRAVVSGGQVASVTILSGGYGYTSVTIQCNTGNTAGTKNKRPLFKWTDLQEPIYAYKRDVRRQQALAGNQQDMLDQAVDDLQGAEATRGTAGLIQYIEQDTIYNQPTDQSSDPWDHQFGLKYAIDYNNNYAGLDRSLTDNYFYRAQKDTTAYTFTLEALYQDMMFTKALAAKGQGPDVVVVGPTLFSKWQKESQAYTMNANTDPNIQVLRRQYGFKMQVIQYNTIYVLMDINVPPNTVYALNTQSWAFVTRSGANFAMSPWTDQSLIEGGKQAWYSIVETQYMLMCLAPAYGNVQYTNMN